jgi:hypothetical protein
VLRNVTNLFTVTSEICFCPENGYTKRRFPLLCSLFPRRISALCFKVGHNHFPLHPVQFSSRLCLKRDVTRAETRFHLSAKQTCPFKSAGASVQSTTGSGIVRIIGSNTGYTMFRRSVKCTDYPLHSPVSPSLPRPCVTVCHHVSTGVECWLHHVPR